MAHVILCLYFLIDIIFLQPIKIILSLVTAKLWRPSVSEDLIRQRNADQISDDFFMERIKYFDPKPVTEDGDGFKFLSIVAANTHGTISAKQAFEWKDLLMSYIDSKGVIGRRPVGDPGRKDEPVFSGDMASGLMYWLATCTGRPGYFTNEEYRRICHLFYDTLFVSKDGHGKKKSLLQFWNVTDDKDTSRGYIYSYLGLAPEVVRLLTWLLLGYKYTNEKVFIRYYRVLSVLYAPLLFVNRGDYGIFIGKVKLLSWFTAHSLMYVFAANFLLTRDNRVFKAAKRTVENRFFSPAFMAIWNDVFDPLGSSKIREDVYPTRESVFSAVDGMWFKGTEAYSGDFQDYFDVKSFSSVTEAASFCPPEMLGRKYTCEDSPLKPKLCDAVRRAKTEVDWLAAATHLFRD